MNKDTLITWWHFPRVAQALGKGVYPEAYCQELIFFFFIAWDSIYPLIFSLLPSIFFFWLLLCSSPFPWRTGAWACLTTEEEGQCLMGSIPSFFIHLVTCLWGRLQEIVLLTLNNLENFQTYNLFLNHSERDDRRDTQTVVGDQWCDPKCY